MVRGIISKKPSRAGFRRRRPCRRYNRNFARCGGCGSPRARLL